MKIAKLCFFFLLTLSIVNCKKDDDGPDLTIDTDGDGVFDINDLCPNEVGTVLDQGCYLLTNVNLTGNHSLTYYAANSTTTITIMGVLFTVLSDVIADTYQASISFTESGTFTLSGVFRTTTTTTPPTGPPIIQIIVLNETGTYEVNDGAQILTFSGSGIYGNGIYNVTAFNQTELYITKEETTTDSTGAITVSQQELRFTR